MDITPELSGYGQIVLEGLSASFPSICGSSVRAVWIASAGRGLLRLISLYLIAVVDHSITTAKILLLEMSLLTYRSYLNAYRNGIIAFHLWTTELPDKET